MDRQGEPRSHYHEIMERIHNEKQGGPRGPDEGQDLDWLTIVGFIKELADK